MSQQAVRTHHKHSRLFVAFLCLWLTLVGCALQLRFLGLWLLLLLGPHLLLSAAQTYTPCPDNDPVCAGNSVFGICCANNEPMSDVSGSIVCQGPGHCTVATPTSSLPVSNRHIIYGTVNGGVLGAGETAINAGTGKITTTTATCGDSTLPDSYTNSALCDKSKVYNTCVRGIQTIAAQQSQTWCQLDEGGVCPANLPPRAKLQYADLHRHQHRESVRSKHEHWKSVW